MCVCVYQEKDISLGGRHGVPFLALAAIASWRHPPSRYSRRMMGSAAFASMFAPTNLSRRSLSNLTV